MTEASADERIEMLSREFRQALSGQGGEEEEDRNEQGKAKDS